MKLNQQQRYALAMWLGGKIEYLSQDSSVVCSFDEFCDGDIPEWRIICKFGLAGKIWNNCGRIYVSGYSQFEIGKRAYMDQQEIIEKWNNELILLLSTYS